jgi:hypothetical protein
MPENKYEQERQYVDSNARNAILEGWLSTAPPEQPYEQRVGKINSARRDINKREAQDMSNQKNLPADQEQQATGEQAPPPASGTAEATATPMPLSAQLLQCVYNDYTDLLHKYHTNMPQLEHAPSQKLMLKILKDKVGYLDDIEQHWGQHYPYLEPLAGMEGQAQGQAQAKDNDTSAPDEAVSASSTAKDEVPAEEAIEGMSAKKKGLKRNVKMLEQTAKGKEETLLDPDDMDLGDCCKFLKDMSGPDEPWNQEQQFKSYYFYKALNRIGERHEKAGDMRVMPPAQDVNSTATNNSMQNDVNPRGGSAPNTIRSSGQSGTKTHRRDIDPDAEYGPELRGKNFLTAVKECAEFFKDLSNCPSITVDHKMKSMNWHKELNNLLSGIDENPNKVDDDISGSVISVMDDAEDEAQIGDTGEKGILGMMVKANNDQSKMLNDLINSTKFLANALSG